MFGIGNCSNEKTPASILTTFINRIELSNRTISKNGKSPEDQALKYLIVNDTTFNISQLSTLSSTTPNVVQFRISQRYALLTLFFQQTVFEKWHDTTGWLVNANECTWKGISCDLENSVGEQSVVHQVNLNSNGIKGTIPADLGLLTALTYFDIRGNGVLTGTLPATIGQWTALQIFDVGLNSLTGTLPASIGQWTALTHFSVFNNALTGTIPTSIVNWKPVEIAYFDGNQFTGSVPVGICPYISGNDQLEADCKSEITCSCCTSCY
jgi:hypothetical protein